MVIQYDIVYEAVMISQLINKSIKRNWGAVCSFQLLGWKFAARLCRHMGGNGESEDCWLHKLSNLSHFAEVSTFY